MWKSLYSLTLEFQWKRWSVENWSFWAKPSQANSRACEWNEWESIVDHLTIQRPQRYKYQTSNCVFVKRAYHTYYNPIVLLIAFVISRQPNYGKYPINKRSNKIKLYWFLLVARTCLGMGIIQINSTDCEFLS